MAVTIGKKFIEKYVLKKLAERSGKRTGITTIQNVKDPQVQFNIEEVRKTIESLGMNPNDVKSVAEIEKIMNIRKAVSDQTLKNKFKNLGLDKGVDDLAKKPPFQGFTPTIVRKPVKGNINYPAMEEKFGFPLRGNESLSELAKIERIGRDSYYDMLANRAMNIRRRMSKVDAEGGTEIGYQEFNKLQEELDGLNDFITRVQKEIPEGMASGGMARVGMFGGGLLTKFLLNKKTVRKAVDDIFPTGDYKYDAEMAAEALVENNPKFFKNKLYDDLSDADRMEVYGSVLSEVQNDLAKMLQTKRLSQPKKTLEGLKKEGTIDISDPEVADEFTRFMKESDPKGFKDLEQKVDLSNLDIKGKKGHASGGRVPMIFGGSAGLKGLIASIKASLNKGRTEKIKTLFPTYSVAEKELLKLGEKYLPKDAATLAAKEIQGKGEGIEILIERLKHDKKLLERQAKNKAMNDPNLDFMMESLEKTMPQAYGPHLKKYTNIDKDILQLETIKKNLIMKDRKLHASGGRAGTGLNYLLGEDDQNVRTPYQGGLPGLLGE